MAVQKSKQTEQLQQHNNQHNLYLHNHSNNHKRTHHNPYDSSHLENRQTHRNKLLKRKSQNANRHDPNEEQRISQQLKQLKHLNQYFFLTSFSFFKSK